MITIKTEIIDINKLKSNSGQIKNVPENPRFIRDAAFSSLLTSISEDPEFLEIREIVVYDNNGELIVVGGNMRYRACLELKIKKVKVKILPKETPAKKLRAFIIKDNLPYGQNDFDMLANEWELDELKEWGLELPDVDLEPDEGENKEIDLDDLEEGMDHVCPRCKFHF